MALGLDRYLCKMKQAELEHTVVIRPKNLCHLDSVFICNANELRSIISQPCMIFEAFAM